MQAHQSLFEMSHALGHESSRTTVKVVHKKRWSYQERRRNWPGGAESNAKAGLTFMLSPRRPIKARNWRRSTFPLAISSPCGSKFLLNSLLLTAETLFSIPRVDAFPLLSQSCGHLNSPDCIPELLEHLTPRLRCRLSSIWAVLQPQFVSHAFCRIISPILPQTIPLGYLQIKLTVWIWPHPGVVQFSNLIKSSMTFQVILYNICFHNLVQYSTELIHRRLKIGSFFWAFVLRILANLSQWDLTCCKGL